MAAESCLYCFGQAAGIFSCTGSCLASAGIAPAYPGTALFVAVGLGLGAFAASFLFRSAAKKFIGLRLLSIASFVVALFITGLVFSGHFILKNLPILIPAVGVGSYMLSYFLSFYILRHSYRAIKLSVDFISTYVKRTAKKLGIVPPQVYLFRSPEPKAFIVDGYRKALFISNRLLSDLDRPSLSAVILHELYHLKRKSGAIKNIFSSLGLRILPVPIKELELYEEEEIDRILLERHDIDMEKIKRRLWP